MRGFSISTILVLAFPLVLSAMNNKTIIAEGAGAFYTVNLDHFADWPGVDESMLIDVSTTDDRVWLIWPRTIISLNAHGMPDSMSLLSLFSSQSASWNGGSWTPENGVLSSKGNWLAYLDSGFLSLDLLSAKVWSIDWKRGRAELLFAAPNGNLVILVDEEAYYVDFSSDVSARLLDFHFPSISAVSTEMLKLAWLDAKGIHLASIEDGNKEIISLPTGVLPAGNPWGISWFDASLVLAYPGTLYTVTLPVEGVPRIFEFEVEWLPERWYRLRGGKNALLIHSLETGKLRIYRIEEEASITVLPSYRDFLEKHAIPAGLLLEEKEEFAAAVRYYNWVLPQIRAFRSRYPLKAVWAKLERELVERRLVLLQMDQP